MATTAARNDRANMIGWVNSGLSTTVTGVQVREGAREVYEGEQTHGQPSRSPELFISCSCAKTPRARYWLELEEVT